MNNNKLYPEHRHLLNLFNAIYPLGDKLEKAIITESNVVQVKKKTRILEARETSNTIYFINKGAARVYYLDKEGTEITS